MSPITVASMVEDIVTGAPDFEADRLRTEAVNRAFDQNLGADELIALMAALERRTGTRLERRAIARTNLQPARRSKH
jgi:hypothetical protein